MYAGERGGDHGCAAAFPDDKLKARVVKTALLRKRYNLIHNIKAEEGIGHLFLFFVPIFPLLLSGLFSSFDFFSILTSEENSSGVRRS